MPILKEHFHRHERGTGDEDWYHLCRDTETEGVFVHHEWSHRQRDEYEADNQHVELAVFLRHQGTAEDKLRVTCPRRNGPPIM